MAATLLFILSACFSIISSSPLYTTTTLPSSCKELSDGPHWLKLLDGPYPAVNVLCSNGYLIIDVSRDDNLKQYFQEWHLWHHSIAGPDPQHGNTWESWWLPSSEAKTKADAEAEAEDSGKIKYLVSPDCSSCDAFASVQSYNDRTAYYMTGTMFLCQTHHKAMRDCAWDFDSYDCVYCTQYEVQGDLNYYVFDTSRKIDKWKFDQSMSIATKLQEQGDTFYWDAIQIGLCGVVPQKVDNELVPQSHLECLTPQQNMMPSVGINGRFCQCVKPDTSQNVKLQLTALNNYQEAFLNAEEGEPIDGDGEPADGVGEYLLFQDDFKEGTYRITKSGTYLVMEDITFDFAAGAGDLDKYESESPNSGFAWWPPADQQEDYPGAYDTRSEYFMGFFAGITIETSDVVLDLQGHTLKQSKAFYYQQRFFFLISLKSVVFNLNNGPGMFGAQPKFASRVTVKNGVLGLSSHMGIHGHGNVDVLLENLHVRDFETHGIEMTDFNLLQIKNVEIGPASTVAYLTGDYAYARFTLQKLERIRDTPTKYDDSYLPIRFAGREQAYTLQDLIERLRVRMDIAFRYVMGLVTVTEQNEHEMAFQDAMHLFLNKDGVPYGAVMYGLFLNLFVSNVFGIHPSLKHSSNAVIENVYIHDLVHRTKEYIRLDKYDVCRYKNPYDASFDAEALLGKDVVSLRMKNIDWTQVTYKGNALTDAHIALELITQDWGEKGLSFVGSQLANWAQDKHRFENSAPKSHPWLGCNNDRMSHLNKGVIGVRLDGVENAVFSNLKIEQLVEQSELGSEFCGPYYDVSSRNFRGEGHFLSYAPYTIGYSGNYAHGIFMDWSTVVFDNLDVQHLYSNTGIVRAIGSYLSVGIKFTGAISIGNLYAGTELKKNNIDTKSLPHPYYPAIATVFYFIEQYAVKYNTILYSVYDHDADKKDDGELIQTECVYGVDGTDTFFDESQYVDTTGSDCHPTV